MRPTLRRAVWIVLFVGLAAGLVFVMRGEPTTSSPKRPEQNAAAGDAGAPTVLQKPGAARAEVDGSAAAPSTRRQVELAFTTPPSTVDAGLRAVRGLGPPKPPTDKRTTPGPRAQQELEILGYAFEALEEDVRECLSQWEALDAGATGEVMLVFQLDSKGLQKTWLDSAADVPFGPRSCISNAVYGLDWANVVTEPAQVSQRFELAPDGG